MTPFAQYLHGDLPDIRGIQLYTREPELRRVRNRVAISSGTGPAGQIDPGGPPLSTTDSFDTLQARYRAGAILPKSPWRDPAVVEEVALWSDGDRPDIARAIGLVRIYERPIQNLASSLNPFHGLDHKDPAILEHPAVRWLLGEVARRCETSGTLSFQAVAQSPLNKVTTTYSTHSQTYFGMHVDDGEGEGLDRLPAARNRISINVGHVDRFLLFINLTVDEMLAAIGAYEDIVRRTFRAGLADSIGQVFLNAFPEYPVVRLRVRPGEAYIAPTENMLHDGSSLGISKPGLQIVFLGRFKVIC